ncbi:hypothetical protein MAPG_01262 [Magnaporthiopsis poae ATCC 64411]|uniref:JmjC domain-containing protein n=1 Tax=Magnaporthiopsis poae (strain ATCC 64411 / 73-15) TaxID=644358 RepID=A0A0C4DN83_MAGP6|nr:hypothetical protein MAPG_01262 [Magnaporthiopsis poae ATCC 64411]
MGLTSDHGTASLARFCEGIQYQWETQPLLEHADHAAPTEATHKVLVLLPTEEQLTTSFLVGDEGHEARDWAQYNPAFSSLPVLFKLAISLGASEQGIFKIRVPSSLTNRPEGDLRLPAVLPGKKHPCTSYVRQAVGPGDFLRLLPKSVKSGAFERPAAVDAPKPLDVLRAWERLSSLSDRGALHKTRYMAGVDIMNDGVENNRAKAGVPKLSLIHPLHDNFLRDFKAIRGIMTPYKYEGKPLAPFAWHVEDVDLVALNHLFLIDRPKTYHSGFSVTYTVAESVNYANSHVDLENYQFCPLGYKCGSCKIQKDDFERADPWPGTPGASETESRASRISTPESISELEDPHQINVTLKTEHLPELAPTSAPSPIAEQTSDGNEPPLPPVDTPAPYTETRVPVEETIVVAEETPRSPVYEDLEPFDVASTTVSGVVYRSDFEATQPEEETTLLWGPGVVEAEPTTVQGYDYQKSGLAGEGVELVGEGVELAEKPSAENIPTYKPLAGAGSKRKRNFSAADGVHQPPKKMRRVEDDNATFSLQERSYSV